MGGGGGSKLRAGICEGLGVREINVLDLLCVCVCVCVNVCVSIKG